MLANLPAKRATRKIISLQDGFQKSRNTQATKKQNIRGRNKIKCGKIICHTTEIACNLNTSRKLINFEEKCNGNRRRNSRCMLTRRKSLRRISKVLSSRILDTDSTFSVKRRLKNAVQGDLNPHITRNKQKSDEAFTVKNTVSKAAKLCGFQLVDENNRAKPTTVISNNSKNDTRKCNKNTSKANIKGFFPVIKPRSGHRNVLPCIDSDTNNIKQKRQTIAKTKLKSKLKESIKDTYDKSKLEVGNVAVKLNTDTSKLVLTTHKFYGGLQTEIKSIARPHTRRKFPSTVKIAVSKAKGFSRCKTASNIVQIDGSQNIMSHNTIGNNSQQSVFMNEKCLINESDTQSCEKMPILEIMPDTPENGDNRLELPILTPAISNSDEKYRKDISSNNIADCNKTNMKRVCETVHRQAGNAILEEGDISQNTATELQTRSGIKTMNNSCIIKKRRIKTGVTCVGKLNTFIQELGNIKSKEKSNKSSKSLTDNVAIITDKLQQSSTNSNSPKEKINNCKSSDLLQIVKNYIKEATIDEGELLQVDAFNLILGNIDDGSFKTILTSDHLENFEKCLALFSDNTSAKEIKSDLHNLVSEFTKNDTNPQLQNVSHCIHSDNNYTQLESSNKISDSQTCNINTTINIVPNIVEQNAQSVNSGKDNLDNSTYVKTLKRENIVGNTIDTINTNLHDCVFPKLGSGKRKTVKRNAKENYLVAKVKMKTKLQNKQNILKQNDDQITVTDSAFNSKQLSVHKSIHENEKYTFATNNEDTSPCCKENEPVLSVLENDTLHVSDSEDELPLVVFVKDIDKAVASENIYKNTTGIIYSNLDGKLLETITNRDEMTHESININSTKKNKSEEDLFEQITKDKLFVPLQIQNEVNPVDENQVGKIKKKNFVSVQKNKPVKRNKDIKLKNKSDVLLVEKRLQKNELQIADFRKKINYTSAANVLVGKKYSHGDKNGCICNINAASDNCTHMQDNYNKQSESAVKAQTYTDSSYISTVLSKNNLLLNKLKNRKNKAKSMRKRIVDVNSKNIYCSICNKSFVRNENLLKHMTTLTHIAKLSEIEAQQNAITKTYKTYDLPTTNINICNILNDSSRHMENKTSICSLLTSTFSLNTASNTSLKLADIINDVLNKPLDVSCDKHHSFSKPTLQSTESDLSSKVRRCKSLGERKSFESDKLKLVNYLRFPNTSSSIAPDSNMTVTTPNCSNVVLQKQISLLENIIEHHTNLHYAEGISRCLNRCSKDGSSDDSSPLKNYSFKYYNKPTYASSSDISEYSFEINLDETKDFLKPMQQYEKVAEITGLTNPLEDTQLNKMLNTDEELFLECCSLLKGESDISKICSTEVQESENLTAESLNKPGCLTNKILPSHNTSGHFISHSNTPCNWPPSLRPQYACNINDSVKQDSSTVYDVLKVNSLVTNSHDNNLADGKLPVFDFNLKSLDSSENSFHQNESTIQEKTDQVRFFINQEGSRRERSVLKTKCQFPQLKGQAKQRKKQNVDLSNMKTRFRNVDKVMKKEKNNSGYVTNKYMRTKGARKVFEGLKVSIPTQHIELSEMLQRKIIAKSTESAEKLNKEENNDAISMQCKTKGHKHKLKEINCKLSPKLVKKYRCTQKRGNCRRIFKHKNLKSYDVYDFEETQDNSDVFEINSLSQYRNFRNQLIEVTPKKCNALSECCPTKLSEMNVVNNIDGLDTSSMTNTFSLKAHLLSNTSSVNNSSCKQIKDQNVTKKKCMIMGRIFKNALKPKCDDSIKEITTFDNNKIITNYVLKCQSSNKKMKPKMSQEKMDQMFNKLLTETSHLEKSIKSTSSTRDRNKVSKQLTPKNKHSKLIKTRKRLRNNTDSTDDEFNIIEPSKKRTGKKSFNIDNSINLEQELKECIGVASRKSQRKCTSGKQNVLVEFWSSDESVTEEVFKCKSILDGDTEQLVDEVTQTASSQERDKVFISYVDSRDEKTNYLMDDKKKTEKSKSRKERGYLPLKRENKTCKKNTISESSVQPLANSRHKRSSVNTLYYWSSSSEEEFQDIIKLQPVQGVFEDEDRPAQHGWIVGDSPKKLVTMLAQAKGKKLDTAKVKEQVRNKMAAFYS